MTMTDKYGIESHKLVYHPERVAQLLDAGDDWTLAKKVYPIYVEISPIGACNHRCSFCAVDYVGYNPVRFDLQVIKQRVPELSSLGIKSIMYAGEGEPLLHKQIAEMAEVTKNSGIDVAFTTNATVLPKDFLDRALPHTSWLKASINAGSADTYSQIHKTDKHDFEKVIKHLQKMVDYRSRNNLDVVLGAQSLLLPENSDEMKELVKICRDIIGLDYLVIKPYSQHLFSDTSQYSAINYEEYLCNKDDLNSMSTDHFQVIFRDQTMKKYVDGNRQRYTTCYATPNLWAYIMADGSVYSCSAYLLDERFNLGNINNTTFQDIWEGSKRMNNFNFVKNKLDIKSCRVNCRMDSVNRYMNSIIMQDVQHINFI